MERWAKIAYIQGKFLIKLLVSYTVNTIGLIDIIIMGQYSLVSSSYVVHGDGSSMIYCRVFWY